MSKEIIIGIIIALVVAVAVGVHGFLHKLANFKMDEGAILKFFRESKEDTSYKFRSTEAIAAETNLTKERVVVVCSKSKAIKMNVKDKESWCVR